jgi:hypothetical protein
MTQPREWPTNAENARMDTIAAADRAIRMINDCLGGITSVSILLKLGQAKDALNTIKILMIQARPGKGSNDNAPGPGSN